MGARKHFYLKFLEQYLTYRQIKYSPARQRKQSQGRSGKGEILPLEVTARDTPPPPGKEPLTGRSKMEQGLQKGRHQTRDREVTRAPIFQTGVPVRS